MNGKQRRRLELSNPEQTPTAEERELRRELASNIIKIGLTVSMTFMVLGAVLIAYVSTRYMGATGLGIAFFGTLINVMLGALIAYNIGKRFEVKSW